MYHIGITQDPITQSNPLLSQDCVRYDFVIKMKKKNLPLRLMLLIRLVKYLFIHFPWLLALSQSQLGTVAKTTLRLQ